MVPDKTGSGSHCLVPKSGGAVFNTAIALGRLNAPSSLFTGVSDDMFGRQLSSELAASQVNQGQLVVLDAPTGLAFVELNEGQAQYTFYTAGAADTCLNPENCPTDLDGTNALFFGGISLCTDPTATTLASFMEKAADQGVVTMIDPNIRQSFIRDEATYRARISKMMSCADIVKISDEDLAWIAGTDTSVEDQVKNLPFSETALILVTKGASGADCFRNNTLVAHAVGKRVEVADTIGAGDTFNAGFLAILEKWGVLTKNGLKDLAPQKIEAAMDYANRCASVTVSRQGANPPWENEVPE